MWNRLYRNHVIMPFPSYDTVTNAWAPQADISWCTGALRQSEFVKFSSRFTTEADAVVCALRSGEEWIDNRLESLRSGSGSERAAVIPWHAEEQFTFGHFKSVIVKSGVKISEPTLQKSYAALVKLRKNNHWSWSQTKERVERSQRDHSKAESPSRQRAARIPLTQRDWGRIV